MKSLDKIFIWISNSRVACDSQFTNLWYAPTKWVGFLFTEMSKAMSQQYPNPIVAQTYLGYTQANSYLHTFQSERVRWLCLGGDTTGSLDVGRRGIGIAGRYQKIKSQIADWGEKSNERRSIDVEGRWWNVLWRIKREKCKSPGRTEIMTWQISGNMPLLAVQRCRIDKWLRSAMVMNIHGHVASTETPYLCRKNRIGLI